MVKMVLVSVILVMAAGVSWSAPGEVIRTFAVPNQPAQGIRGLAYDWADSNVWAAGVEGEDNIRFTKFNPETGSTLTSWGTLEGAYWQYDLGYGYLISGKRHLLAVDSEEPRIRIYDTTGSYVGSMRDPFVTHMSAGIDCDWGGTNVFFTNYNYNQIQRWNGTSWMTWAVVPMYCTGVATGWGRVFAVSVAPDYKIYEYFRIYGKTGSLNRVISLDYSNGFAVPGNAIGLSIGRVDAIANEETVFLAVYSPVYAIYEVSIGDVTNTTVTPASLGRIKSLFK